MASSTSTASPEADADAECAVCYLGVEDVVAPLRATACRHTFCEHCIGSYALKVPPPSPVPCPLCRAPLSEDELPSTLTLSLQHTVTRPLGLRVRKDDDEEHVSIISVAGGSPAAVAGLRVGMWVLSVNGARLTRASELTEILRAVRHGASVQLLIGRLRAPPVPSWTAMAGPQLSLGGATPRIQPLAACCCFCNVIPQIWQRTVYPAKQWLCVAFACLLWVYSIAAGVFDHEGTRWVRVERATLNVTDADVGWHVHTLRRFGLVEWTNGNLSDGFNLQSEVYALLGAVFVSLWWVTGATMLYYAVRRIRRDEPQVWERAMAGSTTGTAERYSTPYGACCCCCELASFLINALVPPTAGYSVWLPLSPPDDAPAPAPRRAQARTQPPARQRQTQSAMNRARVDVAPPPTEAALELQTVAPTTAAAVAAALTTSPPRPSPRVDAVVVEISSPPAMSGSGGAGGGALGRGDGASAPSAAREGAPAAEEGRAWPSTIAAWFSPGGSMITRS